MARPFGCALLRKVSTSVVIPSFNRASVLPRAINSVLGHCGPDVEVIVVDDASVDDTRDVVRRMFDDRIRYIRLQKNRGGGGARNVGVDHARGDYIAFLDSDDEWLPHHLQNSIGLLEDDGLDGVFSSFFVERNGIKTVYACARIGGGQSLPEYILGAGGGDPRSSTLVFRVAALRAVRFDESLRKQQDWDLAIRFAKTHQLGVKPDPSVILHVDAGDRMSAQTNPEATRFFLDRYANEIGATTSARVYTRLMYRALRDGDVSDFYSHCRKTPGQTFALPVSGRRLRCLS